MMVMMLSRRMRQAVCLSAALLAAACGGDKMVGPNDAAQPLPSGVAPATAPFRLGVEFGGSRSVGQLVQVSVVTEGQVPEGLIGLQGFLRYDAAKLTYEGVDAAHGGYVAVNDQVAGELRASAVALPQLKRDAMVFVFRVKSADFASGLRFELEEASTKDNRVFTNAGAVGTREVQLASVATPSKPTLAEWNSILERQGYNTQVRNAARPGDGTIYGDVNLSGGVSIADVTYLGNVAVAGFPLLDPAANRDGALAGNIRPVNNADGIEVGQGDPCPPGVVCTGTAPNFRQTAQGVISTADVGQVLLSTVQAVAVVGQAIPKVVATSGTVAIAENVYNVPAVATVAGNGFAVGDSVCGAAGGVQMPLRWTRGNLYRLDGVVQVGGGCTLRIESGVTVAGNTAINPNALYIQRDGRIFAEGTSTAPIVFTCTGTKNKGCWGGVAIAGNAPVNLQQTGIPTAPAIPGRNPTAGGLTRALEGPVPLSYGGDNPTDNSGVMRYVRIEYAGFIVGTNNELNGLTVGGVGSGTTIEYVQIHGGLDDGYEMFGGTVNARYLLLTANQDDDFDWAFGWQGSAQFVIGQKDSLDGDTGFEGDNSEGTGATFNETPRTNGPIYNFTMVAKLTPAGTGTRGVNTPSSLLNIRRGNWSQLANIVGLGWPNVIDLDDAATCTNAATDPEIRNSHVGLYTNLVRSDAEAEPTTCFRGNAVAPWTETAWFNDAAVNNTDRGAGAALQADLIRPFDVQAPDFRPVPGSTLAAQAASAPPAGNTFIVATSYIGAVEPATPTTLNNIPWYAGWTRGWTTALVP